MSCSVVDLGKWQFISAVCPPEHSRSGRPVEETHLWCCSTAPHQGHKEGVHKEGVLNTRVQGYKSLGDSIFPSEVHSDCHKPNLFNGYQNFWGMPYSLVNFTLDF